LAKFRKSIGLDPLAVGGRRAWSALLSQGTTPHLKKGEHVAKPASNNKATKGEKALAYAKKQLGDPYRRRGTGPNGWDCSGLTMKAWQAAGVKLPHSAGQQYRIGKKISKSDLRSGDLVFFYRGISHVGLYAGNGKVIHAPRPGKQVSYIKMSHMPYMGARRPG
jgi:cell wall-associated NlpC family hydrolase